MKRLLFACLPPLIVCGIPQTSAAQDQSKQKLAEKTLAIFKTNCYRCHGQDGANEGGFNYILNLQKLVERRKVRPGNAKRSKLLYRILNTDDPMPPPAEQIRPSKDDVAVLRQWIDAGAPLLADTAKQRTFVSSQDVVRYINRDLAKVKSTARRHTRYFTLTHLYNAGLSDDELQSHRHSLSKLTNSLSWGKRIVVPRPVDPAKTIFGIDLRDYGWDEKVWDAIVAANPYGMSYEGENTTAACRATGSKLPYVRGDWFVAAASRPPLYHDVLQLPQSQNGLERMMRIDTAENIRRQRVARAGFNSSGVSRNNRLIERHQSGSTVFWVSYDFAANIGRQNLFAHPLGPGEDAKHFQHDGGEIIFTLPNGLQAYMLVNDKGQRIDKGPQSIVSDPKRPDRAVENGISCMSCHARGMIVKQDQIREHVLENPGAFVKDDRKTILTLYPKKDVFLDLLKKDGKRFQEAVKQTGAPLSISEPVVTATLHFEAEMDIRLVAAEAGVQSKELLAALQVSPLLAKRLGPLKVKGGTVQRQVFVNSFPHIVRALRLGKYLAPANTAYTRAVARGDALFEKGETQAAVAAYTEAGRLNPDHPLAYLHRGSIFRAKRDYVRALADFSEAIRIDPELADAWHTRASTYHDRRDYPRAIADYTNAIQLDPKDATLFNNRGLALADSGQSKRAIDDFAEAIRLDSGYAIAHHNRGRIHFRLGDVRKALADFDTAIKLNPKSAAAWHSRAALHHRGGDFRLAIADYTKAIKLDPKNAVAYNNRGYAHFQNRNFRKAIADCTQAIRFDPKLASAYFNRSNAHKALGDFVQAAADRRTAIRLDPALDEK